MAIVQFLVVVGLALVTSLSASTQTLTEQNNCSDKLEGHQNLQIQQTQLTISGPCYLSIHPRDAFDTLIYRDYLLTSEGLFMVFNSLASGEGPGSHGAREFFVFPSNFKGYSWEVNAENLIVRGFYDLTLTFSLKTAQLTSISQADILVAKKVEASNRGGVEILRSEWPFIDSGFRLGGAPSERPKAYSNVRNGKGESCRVLNSEIFDYQNDDVKLRDRESVAQAARKTCSGFILEANRILN